MSEPRRPKTMLVLLEPDGAARTYQFRVRYGALRALGVLLLCLVVGFLVLVIMLARTLPESRSATALREEIDSLRVSSARMTRVEMELEELRKTNRQLLELVGVPADAVEDLTKWTDEPGNILESWKFSNPSLPPYLGVLSRGYSPEEGAGHPGVDVAGPEGGLVVAAGGGIVSRVDRSPIYGNEIVLDHGEGIESFYGHNREILVAVGDSVGAGESIARLGNTGQSSAPHLHFEVRRNGVAVDPGEFIREYGSDASERMH